MEGIKVVTFNNLIIRIFKSHGFEINSSSDYSKYILASKDNINLSIGYLEPGEEIAVAKIRNFYRDAKKDNADRFIYIIPSANYPNNIDKFADDRRIQIWDRERFERELGRAVLSKAEDLENITEFIGELGEIVSTEAESLLEPTASELETSSEEIPIMVPFFTMEDETEAEKPAEATTTTSTTPEPSSTERPENLPEQIEDVRIIKPKVTKDNAVSMANKIVRGFRFNLELIPYYIFSYKCKFDSNVPGESESSGVIGINGLTSNIEGWSGNIETVKYLDEPHTKLELKFPYEKALSLANDAVIELNTKTVETKEESDSTIIFEKKKLKPKPDAIELRSKGLYYLPVWCIEGSNGLMIIDASSGKIIKEDFFEGAKLLKP